MFTKVVPPGSFQFDEQATEIHVSSRGLRGNDLSEFVKQAGHVFVDALPQVKTAEGEIPVWMPAVGATEHYGPNRNGDGFRDSVCRDWHGMFEKYARAYRNHKNKDTSKSYGRVVKSAYNDKMHRIELLVAYNGTEKAAKANGGLLADREMEKLAKHEPLPVSMACSVAYDTCSGCGNKAKTRADYCDDDVCSYGGLKHNIGKTASDGHMLHADNPEPYFFDISHVFRPADRIAYAFGQLKQADALEKSGADLAAILEISVPLEIISSHIVQPHALRQFKVACDLRTRDQQAAQWTAWDAALNPNRDFETIAVTTPLQVKEAATALARAKVVLPPAQFFALICGSEKAAEIATGAALAALPGIWTQLSERNDIEQLLSANPYAADGVRIPAETVAWADKLAADFSVDRRVAGQRLLFRQVDSQESKFRTKQAARSSTDLATHYALYQLGFLSHWQDRDSDFPLTTALTLRQNYLL